MSKPGPSPEVTLEDVLGVFDARDDPAEPLTAPEIADKLGCSRRTALKRLQELGDRGDLASKKVGGRSRVWWYAQDGEKTDTPDFRSGFGAFKGTDLGERVEEVGEEFDRDIQERQDALFGN